MAHVQGMTGTSLVELGGMTQLIGKRELGELRTIAAEIRRESYEEAPPLSSRAAVHNLLLSGQISLHDLERLEQGDEDAALSLSQLINASGDASKQSSQ